MSAAPVALLAAASTPLGAAQKKQRPTAFVYHPEFLLHDPGPDHPERPARLEAIVEYLRSSGLLHRLQQIDPPLAPIRWLTTIHPLDYLQRLEQASANAPFEFDADTRVSAASYTAARRATGAMLAAADAIVLGSIRNAFVAARPPGHHALPERAMGFCLINHVAVAARYIQQHHGLARVLIIDWDVHHGNGTQEIFYDDPSVMYFSVHQWPYYPGTGAATETGIGKAEGTTINVPLPAASGDAELIRAFERHLVPAAERFRPDFVLVSAGFDAHRDDPLAGFALTADGYRRLTEIVMRIAAEHSQDRVISLLEGGYDLDALARSVAAHIEALM